MYTLVDRKGQSILTGSIVPLISHNIFSNLIEEKLIGMDERKKRIREHLARSSGGETNFQQVPQNYNSERNASASSSKTSRMEHLSRSLGNYNLNAGNGQERKSRIMEHLRLTKG